MKINSRLDDESTKHSFKTGNIVSCHDLPGERLQ
jgi:hypothetical protein